jgi:hypothetical protein
LSATLSKTEGKKREMKIRKRKKIRGKIKGRGLLFYWLCRAICNKHLKKKPEPIGLGYSLLLQELSRLDKEKMSNNLECEHLETDYFCKEIGVGGDRASIQTTFCVNCNEVLDESQFP